MQADHKERAIVRSTQSSHNQKEMAIEKARMNEQNVKDDRHFALPLKSEAGPYLFGVISVSMGIVQDELIELSAKEGIPVINEELGVFISLTCEFNSAQFKYCGVVLDCILLAVLSP